VCSVTVRGLDEALDSARRGDESGVAELWRALNPLILRYLRVVVGEAAEDVASETWLQAARDIRHFRGDAAGFRVWLFRVARHRALAELRRGRGRREELAGLSAAEDRAARDDPAGEAVERLATRRALRMIADLPPNQAEAVLLRVVAGLDAAQAAAVLGKRPGAVRVAAMRGLRRLAEVIEAERGPQTELGGAVQVLGEVAE
jgi:RNA polymerase sigma-70 factor (ECF subfamily)